MVFNATERERKNDNTKNALNHFIKIERAFFSLEHLIYLSTHVHFSSFSVYIVGWMCIPSYRAVVWTDFIQFVLMMFAIVIVVVLGANNVGGFSNVWSAAERGGRLIIFK